MRKAGSTGIEKSMLAMCNPERSIKVAAAGCGNCAHSMWLMWLQVLSISVLLYSTSSVSSDMSAL